MNNKIKKYKHTYIIVFASICICIFILYSFSSFFSTLVERRTKDIKKQLQDLSVQYTYTIRLHFQEAIEILSIMAETIEFDEELESELMINSIKSMVDKNLFTRVGIINNHGESVLESGLSMDNSEQEFFNESMKGNIYISNLIDFRLNSGKIFIISVPIVRKEEVVGVLYGVYNTSQLYNLMESSGEERYISIFDSDGDFLFRSINRDDAILLGGNIWVDFQFVEDEDISELNIDELKDNIKNLKNGFIDYKLDSIEYIAYYMPLDMNGWYLLSVTEKSYIYNDVNLIKNLVYNLLGRILILFFIIMGSIIYSSSKYQNKIIKANQELKINEEFFKAIVLKTSHIIFEYDNKTKELTFKTYGAYKEYKDILPKKIKNAPDYLEKNNIIFLESLPELYKMYDMILNKEEMSSCTVKLNFNEKITWQKITVINIFNDFGEIVRSIGTIEDVTEQKQNEISLKYKAQFDALTKIYNRDTTQHLINKFLDECKIESNIHAFMIVDLDNFKLVNDNLGHTMGDNVLIDVANKMKNQFRKTDIIGRLGGDEFIIFLKDLNNLDFVKRSARELVKKIKQVYSDGIIYVDISASIGISISKKDGSSFEELYKKADMALYTIKKKNKNDFALYSDEMAEK